MDSPTGPSMDYVCGFMFNHDGTLVKLIRKLKPNWQRGRLNGIGGKIQDGEPPISAMVREFREEAGVPTAPEEWYGFCDLRGINGDFEVYFYKTFAGPMVFEAVRSMEEEQIATFYTHELPNRCIDNLRWLIPMALAKSRTTAEVVDG